MYTDLHKERRVLVMHATQHIVIRSTLGDGRLGTHAMEECLRPIVGLPNIDPQSVSFWIEYPDDKPNEKPNAGDYAATLRVPEEAQCKAVRCNG